MHEENFLSSWLREAGKSKTKREMEVDEEVREDELKKCKEAGRNKKMKRLSRGNVNPVSVEAFSHFHSSGNFGV